MYFIDFIYFKFFEYQVFFVDVLIGLFYFEVVFYCFFKVLNGDVYLFIICGCECGLEVQVRKWFIFFCQELGVMGYKNFFIDVRVEDFSFDVFYVLSVCIWVFCVVDIKLYLLIVSYLGYCVRCVDLQGFDL